ncbi:MAG: PIN domain-containing protein [Candidatus Methanoperedens sp.]|nr:PIN domain-containing protein [Candidatus Methanoperedens sp.]MCZ7396289.1 PIN domain-containing protein [Candidatus Methanoperedens sp.]
MDSFTLDTDIVIEILRGNQKAIKKMKSLPQNTLICITGLTVYELYKGVLSVRNTKLESDVRKFIESVEVLQLDSDIEKAAGEIYVYLRKKGELINDADILIAATVLANNSVLVTNNEEHFKRIESLKLENWLQ